MSTRQKAIKQEKQRISEALQPHDVPPDLFNRPPSGKYRTLDDVEQDCFERALQEMTPSRRNHVSGAFKNGAKIPMRQMSFGGDYTFTEPTQVYLEGNFSKMDLLRLALVMSDVDNGN